MASGNRNRRNNLVKVPGYRLTPRIANTAGGPEMDMTLFTDGFGEGRVIRLVVGDKVALPKEEPVLVDSLSFGRSEPVLFALASAKSFAILRPSGMTDMFP